MRPRPARPTDRQLFWAARKLASTALTPEDELLDIYVGQLKRFRDNGVDKEIVTPKKWARHVPFGRGLTIITYTRVQLLFLADGFGVNCSINSLYRAEVDSQQHLLFAFSRRNSPLAVLEFAPAAGSRAQGFLERLMAARGEERAKLPVNGRAELERIDLAVCSESLQRLWVAPALITTVELSDQRHGVPVAAHRTGDGVDEAIWNRMRSIALAAHLGNAYGYTQAIVPPEGSGLGVQHRISLYLLYLLRSRIRQVMQEDDPTAEGLHELAGRLYPKVREVLGRAPENHLEEALRRVFGLPPAATEITAGQFTVIGGAALGVLMADPEQELEELRPGLAAWWSRNQDSFRAQGVAD